MILDAEAESGRELTNAELDALLRDTAAGDMAAFERLYRATRAAVYGFALSVLRNAHDAEDVLHDCCVAVWHGAGSYRSQGKPLAWVMTIARNLCLQRIRERQKTADTPPEEWELSLPDDRGLSVEDRSVLLTCMEQLSAQERQIVMLHAVGGVRHREIAALLELPLSTVLSKYRRAINRLKQIWQQGGQT